MTRAEIRALLLRLAQRLAATLTATPFSPVPAYRIGAELVAAGFVAPEALARTVALVTGRLRADLDFGAHGADATARRTAAVVEALVCGFARASRDRTLDEQEAIRTAALAARQAAERALRATEVRLRYAALYDQLTALPNRGLFAERLAGLLTDAPAGARIGVCAIGVDGFTPVNDSLGLQVGDQLLVEVADRLGALAQEWGFLPARLGGDEFAVLVTGTSGLDDMIKIADRVLGALTAPVHAGDHELPISASIGIVERPVDGTEAGEIMRAADISLRWAKADGGRRWTVFDPERNARDVSRFRLSAAMPGALDRDEFTVAYQPLVNLADRSVRGVEALARWQHPELGVLGPDRFIDLAENTGLIVRLGRRILERACAQAAQWERAVGPAGRAPFVSVNVAVRQLRQRGLVAEVAAVLDDTGLTPDLLQLEITETALMERDDVALETLHGLADLGVQLAIDDFGTGYANLARLRVLPVHGLKLAGYFLRCFTGSEPDPVGEKLLRGVVTLGQTLGFTVTAEGVESAVQARKLAELGCTLGQGWHLGRPGSAARISQLLAT
jgi:diguanylate cyclase